MWLLGNHRVYCGDALDATVYGILLDKKKVAAVFTDPPYNIKIGGHVSGNGAINSQEIT